MSLKEYFETATGFGVLSTADADGKVDAAVYAKPHCMEDGSIAFIMRDRLTHANLQSNACAAYLFREDGKGYSGKRLFLSKIGEEKNSESIRELERRSCPDNGEVDRFLVFFRVDKELPLVGSGGVE